ncbi:MAG: tetratricopeptide repeat protein [Armatimonas sp.]
MLNEDSLAPAMTMSPSGTVTFLFTDIEGSTRLWEAQPEQMRLALASHDILMRNAIVEANGHVFKTMGDAFCAAFTTAPDAVAAMLACQIALARQVWPAETPIKVRMALHTGAVESRDNDYFGPPVNRVARLLAIGHGGQSLLSQSTYELSRDHLPDGVELRSLGEHRLKDLSRPEAVFQLLHPDLPANDLPLRSLSNPELKHNLPQQLTNFVGREKERAEVTDWLQKTRLLTLTGSGGTGKTRLAMQAAAEVLDDMRDGVWMVELAALSDPALVPQAAADVLGLKEEPGKPIQQTLTEYLKSQNLLLILDNCEHVLEACAKLANAFLRQCPGVLILATSRASLGIAGETTYRVPSLSLPDPKQAQTPETLPLYEAVRLFIDRAVQVQATFRVTNQNAPALASICNHLDGIPLAIELAAARVRILSVEDINGKLDQCFRLLTGGSRTALPRQQTLRALIDWSYDLLTEQEKTLFRRLSVFAGGWTMEAAERVCSDSETPIEDWEVLDLLTSLCDKSLVVVEELGSRVRYRLLETVRQYGRDRLAEQGSEMVASVRTWHGSYFLALAEEVEPKLTGPEQQEWMQCLEEEHGNLRAALEWSLSEEGLGTGLRLCGALYQFWSTRALLSEGRDWCERQLRKSGAQEPTQERAKALSGAGVLAMMQGDFASAHSFHEESLSIRRQIGDRHGMAVALQDLGIIASDLGDYRPARAYLEESLVIQREIGDQRGMAISLICLGRAASAQGEYAMARAYLDESLVILVEIEDRNGYAWSLTTLGNMVHAQGDYGAARAFLEQGLTIRRDIGDRYGMPYSLNSLGDAYCALGNYASARDCQEESLALFQEFADKYGMAQALHSLGDVASAEGDYRAARARYEESLVIKREIGDRSGMVYSLEAFAGLAVVESALERAAALWGVGEAQRENLGLPIPPSMREPYNRAVAGARETLGNEVFSGVWAQGRAMTMEQAAALALKDSDS